MTREDAQPAADGNIRKRRRLLLWLSAMLVVAVVGWVAVQEMRYRQWLDDVGAIESFGGFVVGRSRSPLWLQRLRTDDLEYFGEHPETLGPNWLRSVLPVDRLLEYLDAVESVEIGRYAGQRVHTNRSGMRYSPVTTPVEPSGLAREHLATLVHLRELYLVDVELDENALEGVRGLRSLRGLYLDHSSFTGATLEPLSAVTSLEELRLAKTEVSDEGLKHLATLTNLRELQLVDTNVTDRGLKHLEAMQRLRLLYLRGTAVTDAGLASIGKLASLEILDLRDTKIEGAGLGDLSGLQELKVLDLNGTDVTDAGVARLASLSNLKTLDLGHTNISDAAIAHLKGMADLQSLDITSGEITLAGVSALRGLKNLRRLRLGWWVKTDAEYEQTMAQLHSIFPACEIDWKGAVGEDYVTTFTGDWGRGEYVPHSMTDPGFLDGPVFHGSSGGTSPGGAGSGGGGFGGGNSGGGNFFP